METLKIQVVENGFIVYSGRESSHCPASMWAFETPERLSNFVRDWGNQEALKKTSRNLDE